MRGGTSVCRYSRSSFHLATVHEINVIISEKRTYQQVGQYFVWLSIASNLSLYLFLRANMCNGMCVCQCARVCLRMRVVRICPI